jgi:hypothetical protein
VLACSRSLTFVDVLRSLNVSLEKDADCLLDNGVDSGLGILINLVEADIVLAIAGVGELRHGV